MVTTSDTAERRAGTVVACAFVAGLAFAVAIAGPDFQSPPPEPYFGLDAPLVEAERPPEVVADDLPTGARALSTRPPVERPQMPDRLALGDAHAVRLALETQREARDLPPPVELSLPAHVAARDTRVQPHSLDSYDQLTKPREDDV